MSTETDETAAVEPPPEAETAPPSGYGWPQRAGRLLLVVMFGSVAIAATVIGLRSRERNDAFVRAQQHPVVVAKGDVEHAVRDSFPPSTSVSCTAAGDGGATRSPWICQVDNERYTVRITGVGAYSGKGGRDPFRGCCIPVPIPTQ